MGKVWKKIKGVAKKAAPVVGAIAGNAILPGIGGAMAGAFLGSVMAGNNTREHLFNAGAAGIGAGVAGAGAGAAGQTGTEVAKQAGTEVAKQSVAQAGTQTFSQSASQTVANEAAKKTFTEAAKGVVKDAAAKYGTQAAIATSTAAAGAMNKSQDITMPSVDNSEETEMLKREKEYEKRKRSSLFETKGGAAGERVGYTGSENRGSIFGN